jgi:hypothetical protein
MDQDHVAKFAGVVARVWADPDAAKKYHADPHAFLGEHGIKLPAGVPAPTIPPGLPKDANFAAWGREMSFKYWDVKVTDYPNPPQNSPLSVSSLACVACPYSCFSSLSN